jgi:hypothetical protein
MSVAGKGRNADLFERFLGPTAEGLLTAEDSAAGALHPAFQM